MIFDGYAFEEVKCELSALPSRSVDHAIFVLGWESRAQTLFNSSSISGCKAFGIRFKDDGVDDAVEQNFLDATKDRFSEHSIVEFGSALDRSTWEGELDNLVSSLSNSESSSSIFVDYTCMPKAITQTLYRMLLRRAYYPRTHWGYCEGLYTAAHGNVHFDQGIEGDFFPIRFTPGKGGTSNERAIILALGGDAKLISTLLEGPDRDHIFVLTANSPTSPELFKSASDLKNRIMRDFHVPLGNFVEADAFSVNDCIEKYLKIIQSLPKECAIEIFCSGPKSHAVAACAIAEKYHGSVSLLGRIPRAYSRHDVPPSGKVSISTVSNFCNPNIRHLLSVGCS